MQKWIHIPSPLFTYSYITLNPIFHIIINAVKSVVKLLLFYFSDAVNTYISFIVHMLYGVTIGLAQ